VPEVGRGEKWSFHWKRYGGRWAGQREHCFIANNVIVGRARGYRSLKVRKHTVDIF
jgi:hypothetical protein